MIECIFKHIQRRRIEKEITWTRDAVDNIILREGNKQPRYKDKVTVITGGIGYI